MPDPEHSIQFGIENAPNACNECHSEESPEWAGMWMAEWYR